MKSDTTKAGGAHTPGPWKAHFEDAYFVTGPDLGRVAMMMNLKGAYGLGGRRSGDEAAANARLIAAAPLMLEALVIARAFLHPMTPADRISKIDAAIAAAIGEQR